MIFIRYQGLEQMCLNVIATNLDRFIVASNIPQSHMYFFRQFYSDKLYKLLKTKFSMNEKYFHWLLSPYWKEIAFRDFLSPDTFKKLQAVGGFVTSLCLKYSLANDDMLFAIISCVPNVKHLDLTETNCSDKVVAFIRKACPFLVSLNLESCSNVTDEGVIRLSSSDKHLTNYDNLKFLNIKHTSVSYCGVIFILQHLPSLQYVKYDHFATALHLLHSGQIHESSQKKYNLALFEHTFAAKATIGDVLETWTVLCPKVTNAVIHDMPSEYEFRLLQKFSHLKKLAVSFPCRYIPSCTRFFIQISPYLTCNGHMLTVLKFRNVTVSVKELTKFCPNLRCLHLLEVMYADFEEKDLHEEQHRLENLETLKLFNTNLQYNFKSFNLLFTSAKKLKKLYFKFIEEFSEKIADVILNSSQTLTEVNFIYTDIRSTSLKKFFALPNIYKIRSDTNRFIPHENNIVLLNLLHHTESQNTLSWQEEYVENCSSDETSGDDMY